MSTTTTSATTPARNRNRVVAGISIAALALSAVAAGVAFEVGQRTTAAASSSNSASHDVQPSNAVKAIQQELAELNFYQGPINGYDTPATVSAVQNLQREAGLPQTGHMDNQTRTALMRYLAQGDNVMNS